MNLKEESNEELLNHLLIENHNIESCARKMQEQGRTDNLWELFEMFKAAYDEIFKEILGRMNNGR